MANQNCCTPTPILPHGYVNCWCPPPPVQMEAPQCGNCGCNPQEEETPIKKKSIEEQICKLSKKSAALHAMIENLTKKGKDAIIKIGMASYNFGPYRDEEGEITEYGDYILTLLKDELGNIKAQLAELASQIDSEEDEDEADS